MKKIVITGALFLLLTVFFSCTTVRAVPNERAVLRFIELYNSGDTERMVSMTSIPMLVDGEIVARTGDAALFWTRLRESGFNFKESGRNYSSDPVDPDSYRLFGDTMEVRTYFSKYVPDTAVVVRLNGPGGDYILLLSGRKGLYPFIFGFTGPLL